MSIPIWKTVLHEYSSKPEPARLPPADPKRQRLKPHERKAFIIQAAADIIAHKGFQSMSMQDVANEIGTSEAALYHYVHSKDELLTLVLDRTYENPEADHATYAEASGTDVDGHRFFYFPRSCVNLIGYNMSRPQMVRMFSLLNGESLNPNHPAHEYFAQRHLNNWAYFSHINWVLPQGMSLDDFHHLWRLTMSAMDGLQYRWFAGEIDNLGEEWLHFSDNLFPQKEWNHLLDPTLYTPEDGCLSHLGLLTRNNTHEDNN